eukprot:PhF_6_TR6073/c0_g1_i7/m.8832
MRLPQAIALRVFCRGPVSIRFCASSCAILAFNSDITTSFLSHCALQSCRVKINSVFPSLACSSKFSIRSRKWDICLSLCAISLSNSTLGTKASRFREVLEVVGFAVVRGGVQGTGVLLRDLFGGGTACLHCTTDGGNLDNFDSNFCTVRLI